MSVCPQPAEDCVRRELCLPGTELMKSAGSACRSGPVLIICASAIYSFIYLFTCIFRLKHRLQLGCL